MPNRDCVACKTAKVVALGEISFAFRTEIESSPTQTPSPHHLYPSTSLTPPPGSLPNRGCVTCEKKETIPHKTLFCWAHTASAQNPHDARTFPGPSSIVGPWVPGLCGPYAGHVRTLCGLVTFLMNSCKPSHQKDIYLFVPGAKTNFQLVTHPPFSSFL